MGVIINKIVIIITNKNKYLIMLFCFKKTFVGLVYNLTTKIKIMERKRLSEDLSYWLFIEQGLNIDQISKIAESNHIEILERARKIINSVQNEYSRNNKPSPLKIAWKCN